MSGLVFFISRDKHTELHWKQTKKLINNLDQKLADFSPDFPDFENKMCGTLRKTSIKCVVVVILM